MTRLQQNFISGKGGEGGQKHAKEALRIKFKRPTINKQLFTQWTSFVLSFCFVIGQLCLPMHEE